MNELPIKEANVQSVISHLLVELTARDLTFSKYFLELQAKESQSDCQSMLRAFEIEKEKNRAMVVDDPYSEYGDLLPEIKKILRT